MRKVRKPRIALYALVALVEGGFGEED